MSQLARIADTYLTGPHVFSIAIHLGFSNFFWQERIPECLSQEDTPNCTHDFLAIALKWLGREEGTGELPRTKDTLMKALRKLDFYEENFEEMYEILLQE